MVAVLVAFSSISALVAFRPENTQTVKKYYQILYKLDALHPLEFALNRKKE